MFLDAKDVNVAVKAKIVRERIERLVGGIIRLLWITTATAALSVIAVNFLERRFQPSNVPADK